jgi:hypothetical protein
LHLNALSRFSGESEMSHKPENELGTQLEDLSGKASRSRIPGNQGSNMTDPTDNASGEETTASRPYPMVLMTENEDEFASLHEELEQDIQPKGFVERMYVRDTAALLWEIIRLRRFKIAIVNNALRMALQNILRQILFKPEFLEKPDYELEADTLAYDWFHSQKAKTQVAKLLRQFRLDESAIEAEAFRLMSSDIDRLDRMLTLAEVRRDKALHCIAEVGDGLARRHRQSSERILEVEDVRHIEHTPTEN